MAAFKPVPPALAARFDASLPDDERVQRRKMFGCPCAFVNGNMFAGVHEDRILVRMEASAREKVLAEGAAKPFEVMGRTMREYVVVPDSMGMPARELSAWITRAFNHTRALPPKQPKEPRKTSKRM